VSSRSSTGVLSVEGAKRRSPVRSRIRVFGSFLPVSSLRFSELQGFKDVQPCGGVPEFRVFREFSL